MSNEMQWWIANAIVSTHIYSFANVSRWQFQVNVWFTSEKKLKIKIEIHYYQLNLHRRLEFWERSINAHLYGLISFILINTLHSTWKWRQQIAQTIRCDLISLSGIWHDLMLFDLNWFFFCRLFCFNCNLSLFIFDS